MNPLRLPFLPLLPLATSVAMLGCHVSAPVPGGAQTEDVSMFQVGQAWTYSTRPGEEESRVIVGRVEEIGGEDVVHIQVAGVTLPHPGSVSGVQSLIPHLPMGRDALAASVEDHVDDVSLDGAAFDEGYTAWRTAHDAEGAGWFTIPVAEVVGVVAEALAGAPQ